MNAPARPLLLAAALVLGACAPHEAPSLETLELDLGYDAVAKLAGAQGEHLHDRGVRLLRWLYEDGSWIEAGVHDGKVSGLEAHAQGVVEESLAWKESRRGGLHSEMTEAELRAFFSPLPVTAEDASDRECRWSWDDGALTALFTEGKLERASWLPAGATEPEILVDPAQRLEELLAALKGGQPPDRYRALVEIRKLEDWKAADGVLQLLRLESDMANRAQAAMILAELGDDRASDLLLNDLKARVIPDAFLDAIGMIGDHRALRTLEDAERRMVNDHTRAKIRAAIARIEARLPPE